MHINHYSYRYAMQHVHSGLVVEPPIAERINDYQEGFKMAITLAAERIRIAADESECPRTNEYLADLLENEFLKLPPSKTFDESEERKC